MSRGEDCRGEWLIVLNKEERPVVGQSKKKQEDRRTMSLQKRKFFQSSQQRYATDKGVCAYAGRMVYKCWSIGHHPGDPTTLIGPLWGALGELTPTPE